MGRFIYPVNGIPLSQGSAFMSISQVFVGIHFSAMPLGVCVIAIGSATRKKSLVLLSIIAGILQIVGTYYGSIGYW